MFNDKGNFTTIHFTVVHGVGKLFEYFFSDGKVSSLLPGKVLFNKRTVGTSKVVKRVGKVEPDVDFAVRVSDFINTLCASG